MCCASRARYAGEPGAGPGEAPAMPGTATLSAAPTATAARRAEGRRMGTPAGTACDLPQRATRSGVTARYAQHTPPVRRKPTVAYSVAGPAGTPPPTT